MISSRFAVAIVLAFVLGACGDDNEVAPRTVTGTPTRTPTDPPTGTPTQIPQTTTPTFVPPTQTPTLIPTEVATPTVESTATTTPGSLLITTDLGIVRGKLDRGVRSFLGIPYASPPLGDLRWRSPLPHPGWAGIRSATSPGNMCPQVIPVMNVAVGNEDCLFLNVHTPDPPPQKPAPVMVWIHGGGFTTGDGFQYTGGTDGSAMVRNTGVLVVSMNYRLRELGFLSHPALSAEDPERPSSGNYGLEDQISALQWVQRNIAAFGGDPHNVTIFGESAGGWSVCAHLAMPRSAGLFQHAIVQSGICIIPQAGLPAAESQGEKFAARLGCTSAEDVLSCMRSKSPNQVQSALPPDPSFAFTEGEFGSWFPVVDGYLLQAQIADKLATGEFNQVPVMVGSNQDEGTIFVMMSHESVGRTLTAENYPERLTYLLHDADLVNAVEARYPVDVYPSAFEALSESFGDGFLACPTIDTARLLAPHVPTYLYQFNFPDAAFALPGSTDLGAFHSAEVQYVFGNPTKPPFTDDEMLLSQNLMGYWTRFAKTGDPNGGDSASWPLLDEAGRYLALDRTIETGAEAKADACAFWRSLDYRKPPL